MPLRPVAFAVLLLTTVSLLGAVTYPVSSVRYEGRPTAFQINPLSDGNEFLVIFDRHVARISANAEMLDPVSRAAHLPGNDWNVAGTWAGNAYLVAQRKFGYQQKYSIATQRLDRSGNALGETRTIDDERLPVAIVGTGSSFLLVTWSGRIGGHLLDASGEVLRTGVLDEDANVANVAATTIGAGALVVTYETRVGIRARVVDQTGTVVRNNMVSTLTNYGSFVQVVGTPSGALAVWMDQQVLRAATFDNNGIVTGVWTVADPPPGLQIRGFVPIDGGALLAGSSLTTSYQFGTLELAFDGKVKRPWVPVHDSITTIASNGRRAIAIDDSQRGLTARAINDDGSLGPVHEFPPLPSLQTSPQIACGPDDCVVVWSEEERDGNYSIRANALDTNGIPVRPDSIEVSNGPGYLPAIARSGDQYLATWQDSSYASGTVFARRLDVRANPLDPAPIRIDENGWLPNVASDGEDFLVAVGGYFDREVTGVRVSADGDGGPPVTLSEPEDGAFGGVSLAWRDGSYLVTYGDNVPCNILCPPRTFHAWTRALSPSGVPIGASRMLAEGPELAPPVIGSTIESSLAIWSDSRAYVAARLRSDGAPDGEPFDLPFVLWPFGGNIATDQARYYLATGISELTTPTGFVAFTADQQASLALSADAAVAAIGVEGSGRPRLIVSESESLAVSRLFVQPVTMWGAEVSLRATVDGLPSELVESTDQEVVVSFWNDGDAPATVAVASTSLGTLLDDDGGACVATSYEINCSWPRLEAHDRRSIRLRLHVPDYSATTSNFEFRATVASRELDRDALNNVVRRDVRIVPRPRTRPLRR